MMKDSYFVDGEVEKTRATALEIPLARSCKDLPHEDAFTCKRANRVTATNEFSGSFGEKRRSSWFYYANSMFKRMRDLGFLEENRFEQLESYFDNWRAGYSHKSVHLDKGETHVFIKQYSRFDGDYREFVRRKLAILDFMEWDLKIELTVDPKKCMRYYDEFHLLTSGWHRLCSWLKRRNPGGYAYFRVLEIQKSGRPHLHVLLRGVKWIDQGELSDLWDSYGCGEIVYVKKVDSENNIKMSSYVMKYVNKTLLAENKRFSAVLFASNRRLFSMSGECQDLISCGRPKKENQGFTFRQSVHSGSLEAYCREKNIRYEPFMILEIKFEDLPEFEGYFDGEGG